MNQGTSTRVLWLAMAKWYVSVDFWQVNLLINLISNHLLPFPQPKEHLVRRL